MFKSLKITIVAGAGNVLLCEALQLKIQQLHTIKAAVAPAAASPSSCCLPSDAHVQPSGAEGSQDDGRSPADHAIDVSRPPADVGGVSGGDGRDCVRRPNSSPCPRWNDVRETIKHTPGYVLCLGGCLATGIGAVAGLVAAHVAGEIV